MNSKHGPNSWDDYLNVHQRRIADFTGHFILEDGLEFTRTASQVLWEGLIRCVDGIEVHVHKRKVLRYRRGRPWVRTVAYSYQVIRRRDQDVVPMFRYDNAESMVSKGPRPLRVRSASSARRLTTRDAVPRARFARSEPVVLHGVIWQHLQGYILQSSGTGVLQPHPISSHAHGRPKGETGRRGRHASQEDR